MTLYVEGMRVQRTVGRHTCQASWARTSVSCADWAEYEASCPWRSDHAARMCVKHLHLLPVLQSAFDRGDREAEKEAS